MNSKYLDPCPACGWYRDENGQCHDINCPWVDQDFDRLYHRMPVKDWNEQEDKLA